MHNVAWPGAEYAGWMWKGGVGEAYHDVHGLGWRDRVCGNNK